MPVSRLSIRLLVPFASNLSRPRARGGDDSLANGGHSGLQGATRHRHIIVILQSGLCVWQGSEVPSGAF